ncbi:MAG: flagellar basal body L-ring protein FlgH [Fimbriimonadaceae bacterium]|nr:flagellar basal body L-ring protein FlgH [Fimbriimonadaceae bacterium]
MKKWIVLALASVVSLSWATEAGTESQDPTGKSNAGSIYEGQVKNPYIDQVARAKGDIVLIVIDERSASNFAASTQTAKGDSTTVSPNILTGLLTQLFGPLSNSATSTTNGTGSTNQTAKMSATMSAIVKDVLPNGNMIIEGSRSLVTNKETQTFVLSGIIRATDITPQNTISSTKIAEAEIKMEGKGQVSERQRKGILTQILDWLF